MGVSIKLAQALLESHPRQEAILRSMLKVAAIGTVADVVDLSTPENRAIVAHGIQGLRAGRHAPGLHALLEVAGVQGEVTSEDLGFRLGPRINAAGRLAKATSVIELFDERDPGRARAKAQELDALNGKRQQIQRKLVGEVLDKLSEEPPPFVVEWGAESEGWHRGVVGIVAAKVRDHTHRPTAIIAVAGDEARGSVRSIPGAHAVSALDSVSALLTAHGGHPAAAGFSLPADRLEDLRQGLCEWAAAQGGLGDEAPTLDVDVCCDADALRVPDVDILAQGLADLGPHGKGNPAPMIQVDGVHVGDIRPMGEKHIRMRVMDVDAIWGTVDSTPRCCPQARSLWSGAWATTTGVADGRCASLWKMLALVLRKLLKRLNQVLDLSTRGWPMPKASGLVERRPACRSSAPTSPGEASQTGFPG